MRSKIHIRYKKDYELRSLYSLDLTIKSPRLSKYKINKYEGLGRDKTCFRI